MVSGYEIPRKQVHICIATAIHCNYDSNIFTTLNSTHLTVGGFKVAKIHKTLYSCFNGQIKQARV